MLFSNYSFNGKEKDDEVYGDGNFLDYGERGYDSRIARFITRDKLAEKFAFYTPYQYAGNKPVMCIDLDGLEDLISITESYADGNTFTHNHFAEDDDFSLWQQKASEAMNITVDKFPAEGVININNSYSSGSSSPDVSRIAYTPTASVQGFHTLLNRATIWKDNISEGLSSADAKLRSIGGNKVIKEGGVGVSFTVKLMEGLKIQFTDEFYGTSDVNGGNDVSIDLILEFEKGPMKQKAWMPSSIKSKDSPFDAEAYLFINTKGARTPTDGWQFFTDQKSSVSATGQYSWLKVKGDTNGKLKVGANFVPKREVSIKGEFKINILRNTEKPSNLEGTGTPH